MTKDYVIILKTKLYTGDIEKQIADLQKKITATTIGKGSGGSAGISLVNKGDIVTLKEIERLVADIKAKGASVQTKTLFSGSGQEIGMTLKYKDAAKTTTTEIYKLADATKSTTEFIKTGSNVVEGSTKSLARWTDGLSNAISRTLQYAVSVGGLYFALNQLKQGVQYIKDLNKEMVNIQVLQVNGAKTSEEISKLSENFNGLAKDMGTTTVEVAKGSVEWLRQGKTIRETQELLRSTMMLSKLGALDSAQATEYLTAILNGFNMKADEAENIVSKLVAIDNIAATSSGELATAMQYSSAVASESGVSFENLAAMVATVSSRTRLSAEMIGQAFRTMMVRMQSVKAGEIDETGQSLNNVEKTLSRVGIALRDSTTSFRPLEDVIADVAGKWKDLDEVTKAQISNAIAGQRQAQIFAVLMQNYGDVTKYVTAEQESLGLATDRYSIYLKSVEASQNRVTASWEKLVQGAISSGAITKMYDSISGLLGFMDKLGGIVPILAMIGVAYFTFTTTLTTSSIAATLSLSGLATGLLSVSAAFDALLLSNPIGLLALAIGGIILGFNYFNETTKETLGRLDKLQGTVDGLSTSVSKLNKQKTSVSDLWKEMETLNDKSDRWYEIQNELRDLLPTVSGYYDEQGRFILDNSVNLKELLLLKQEEIDLEKEKLAIANKTSREEAIKAYKGSIKKIENLQAPQSRRGYGTNANKEQLNADLKEASNAQKEYMNQIKQNYYSLEKSQQALVLSSLDSGDAIDRQIALQLKSGDSLERLDKGERDNIETVERLKSGYKDFETTLKTVSETISGADDLISNYVENGLSLSDISKVPPEYLDSLSVEGDKLVLNTGLIREKELATLSASLTAIKAAQEEGMATQQQVDVVQLAYNQLMESIRATHGEFAQSADDYNALLWDIANQAEASGYSFVDLEGKALNSAKNIFAYMQSSDVAFNNLALQIATATGRSVAEVMAIMDGMATSSYNHAVGMINSLGGMIGGKSPDERQEINDAKKAVQPLFPGAVGSYTGGGGSGGSSGKSAEEKKAEAKAKKLKEIEQDIAKARKEAIDSLNKQLKIYKSMVDERKKLLDTMSEERKYQQDEEAGQNVILNIQNQISELMLDNSAEAKAQVLALEEQLASAQQDFGNLQYEHGISSQKDALDTEYARLEANINNMIGSIEGIDATSLRSFTKQLADILSAGSSSTIPTFHSGLDSGVVGGGSNNTGEQFSKLMKGEVVINPEQMRSYMDRVMPETMASRPKTESKIAGGMDFDNLMNIVVNGNLDKTVIPDIERIAKGVIAEINKTMLSRGFNRRADSFQI